MKNINELIIEALSENNDENYNGKLNGDTPIFGGKGGLDSLGLVTFLITLEQKIEDNIGAKITIADERAISMKNSPFRNLRSLESFIKDKINT